jgi:L-threonylcarbamoyladenylate synthase
VTSAGVRLTAMREALDALRRGEVVAAATESFFGLLADVARPDALDRLLALKPRGLDKGMPIVLPARTAWNGLVRVVPPVASALADTFWPGPLTIALAAAPGVDARVTLDGRVGVRVPGECAAADLVRAYDRPLTATSANPPGLSPAMLPEHVFEAFRAAVGQTLNILDGTAPGGEPSTVVVVEEQSWSVVRAGRITAAEIAATAALDPGQRKR